MIYRPSEQTEHQIPPKPNFFTKNIYATLQSSDINFQWINFLKQNPNIYIWEKVKNFLEKKPENLIENIQQYQLKKFLGEFRNIKIQLIWEKLFANSKLIKSRILENFFTNLISKWI